MVRISACQPDDSTIPGEFFGITLYLDNSDRYFRSVDYEIYVGTDRVVSETGTVIGPGEEISQQFSVVAPDEPGEYPVQAEITNEEAVDPL